MKFIKFSQILDFQKKSKMKAGEGLTSGTFPFFTSSPTLSKYTELAQFKLPSVIFGTGGSASIHVCEKPFSVSTDCLVAQIKPELSKDFVIRFIYYYLFKNIWILEKGFKGAGLRHISKSYIENIPIPELSLEDQKRIVKILDAADALRQKRKQAITLLDDYLKSVFSEMFGASINDQTNYSEIKKITTFIDYRGKTPEKSSSGIPLITAKHVKKGFFLFEPEEYVSEEKYSQAMTRGFPKANDVLFTTEGATLGNVCRIPYHMDKFGVGQRLITLQCKSDLTPEYLHFILLHEKIRLEIFKQATGSAAQGIRSAIFAKIKIPVPPRNVQERFSLIVKNSESIKHKMLIQSQELEMGFQALMQKAFKGEL